MDSLDLDFSAARAPDPSPPSPAFASRQRHNEPLVLDGEGLDLVSVSVDGVPYQAIRAGESSLTLFNLPAEVRADRGHQHRSRRQHGAGGVLKLAMPIAPSVRGRGFQGRISAAGQARHPGPLHPGITADKAKYPYLLSNGSKVASGDLDDGRRTSVRWDRFPETELPVCPGLPG